MEVGENVMDGTEEVRDKYRLTKMGLEKRIRHSKTDK